jgi:hypothetical protein
VNPIDPSIADSAKPVASAEKNGTRLYLLVIAAASSVICGYVGVAVSDYVIPEPTVSLEQKLEWHRSISACFDRSQQLDERAPQLIEAASSQTSTRAFAVRHGNICGMSTERAVYPRPSTPNQERHSVP